MTALYNLTKDIEELIDGIPERRAALHKGLAVDLKAALDSNIISSGLNDGRGKIRSWQSSHVGSGGGYVAVRPDTGKATDRAGRETKYPKARVTMAQERGHRHRPPGKAKSRIKVPRARAYGYYGTTQGQAEQIGQKSMEKWAEEIKRKLEGG